MQKDLHIDGHAVEVRLYAEDPDNGFLPSIGTLERLRLPEDVRVDSGVREGDAVTPYYDPMIAKVIAHDTDRTKALTRLADALSHAEIAGLRTNNAFLIRALRSHDFVAGEIDTGFIDRHLDELLRGGHAEANTLVRERQPDPWHHRRPFLQRPASHRLPEAPW